MSKHHELKIHRDYFIEVESGRKTFEIRRDDRDFQKGDTVTLKEVSGLTNGYTGKELKFKITYITCFAQQDGFVVFGIKPIN